MASTPAGTTSDAAIVIDSDAEEDTAQTNASRVDAEGNTESGDPAYLSDGGHSGIKPLLDWLNPLVDDIPSRGRLEMIIGPLTQAIKNESHPWGAGVFTKEQRHGIDRVLHSWSRVIRILDGNSGEKPGRKTMAYGGWVSEMEERNQQAASGWLQVQRSGFQSLCDLLPDEHQDARPFVRSWITLYRPYICNAMRREDGDPEKEEDD